MGCVGVARSSRVSAHSHRCKEGVTGYRPWAAQARQQRLAAPCLIAPLGSLLAWFILSQLLFSPQPGPLLAQGRPPLRPQLPPSLHVGGCLAPPLPARAGPLPMRTSPLDNFSLRLRPRLLLL